MRYRDLVRRDSTFRAYRWADGWWAGSDDQRYRATYAECGVDALQWNGAHVAPRRQVIDPA